MKFIIDENLPENFPLWNDSSFCHVLKIKNIVSDSDIWQYALDNDLIIITKDTDFYFRFLSAHKSPKIVWLRLGNLRKKELRLFIENVWEKIEMLLKDHSFIIVDDINLKAF
jgi:predicted nuclease of predicted toxin-antitoxin system